MPAALFMPVTFILYYSGWGFFGSILWGIPITIGVIALLFGVILLYQIATKDAKAAARKTELLELRAMLSPIVSKHMPALLRKRRIMIAVDEYGLVNNSKWNIEVERFFDNIVLTNSAPGIPRLQLSRPKARSDLLKAIMDMVENEQANKAAEFVRSFDSSMSPVEYEHFCAERLRQAGWKAAVTKGSGDQGADIIATRARQTIVIQCKHYAKPVGNKAVQEAVAAMRHYDAKDAIVVATNGFTKAAHSLAATNGVHLIGHDDLTSDWTVPS